VVPFRIAAPVVVVSGAVYRGVDHVVGGTVLVDDVVGVEGDELHGADLERVEVAAQAVAVPVGYAVVG